MLESLLHVVRETTGPSNRVARRLFFATAAAVFLVVTLATHVFVDMRSTRAKLLKQRVAAEGGVVSSTTAGISQIDALRPPFALIVQIDPGTGDGGLFSVVADGEPVCERRLTGGGVRRLDCTVSGQWTPGITHTIEIKGTPAAWAVEYLELATHFGRTGNLFVVPRASMAYATPSAVPLTIASLAVIGLLMCPSAAAAFPTWLRLSYRALAAGIIGTLVAIVASPWVSDYRVILSPAPFAWLVAAVLAPRLWFLSTYLELRKRSPKWNWGALGKAAAVATVVVFAYGAMVDMRLGEDYRGNYSGFVTISEHAFDKNPLLHDRADIRRTLIFREGGYDAQFFYFETFDPLLLAFKEHPEVYRSVVDTPPYRYGRIGFTLLTYAFAAGRWERYPITMVGLTLGGIFVAALALSMMAQDRGMPAACGGLIACVPSFWTSVETALPEPIAAAALLLGLLCVSRRSYVCAFVLFALSLLVRETSIIAIGCVVAAAVVTDTRRSVIAVGVGAVMVLGLWRAYVAWRLFPDWGIQGLLFHPPGLGLPFAGLADLWRAVGRGEYYPAYPEVARSALLFPFLLVGGSLIAATLCIISPSAASASALLYGIVPICLNYQSVWLSMVNGQRTTFELFVMLSVSTLGFRSYSRPIQLALIGFWIACAAYVLFGAYDASEIRKALNALF